MTAGLETANGKVAFASLREPAWHGLGTVFTEPVSLQKMMELSYLNDWNVRLEDVSERFPEHSFTKLPRLAVRDNPFNKGTTDALSVVGEVYEVHQNEELMEWAALIVSGGDYTWETMGSINEGRVVFGSLKFSRSIFLDPSGRNDQVDLYLMVYQSHDGTHAICVNLTPVRVVCANTLDMAIKGCTQKFATRHTSKLEERKKDAFKVLGIANTYVKSFEEDVQAMIQTYMSQPQLRDLFAAVYTEPAEDAAKGAHQKWENKRDKVEEIYFSDTCENVRGTVWGGINALTERLDWHRTARKGNTDAMLVNASGFDLATTNEKNRIISTARQLLLSK